MGVCACCVARPEADADVEEHKKRDRGCCVPDSRLSVHSDYQQQAWNFFLASKEEAPKLAQNQLIITSIVDEPPQQVPVNGYNAIPFENECFEGLLLFMVRTHDEDETNPYAPYLLESDKWLELQLQGKFKTQPHGTVYFGVELPRMLELSRLASSFSHGVIMALSALNTNLGKIHFSVVTKRDTGKALESEASHAVYPLNEAADGLIVTELSDPPPKLGPELPWQKDPVTQFDTNHLYTFRMNTKYIDLLQWRIVNMPGVSYVDLRAYITDQPILVVIYDLLDQDEYKGMRSEIAGDKVHAKEDKCFYMNVALNNIVGDPRMTGSPGQKHSGSTSSTASTFSGRSGRDDSDSGIGSSNRSFPIIESFKKENQQEPSSPRQRLLQRERIALMQDRTFRECAQGGSIQRRQRSHSSSLCDTVHEEEVLVPNESSRWSTFSSLTSAFSCRRRQASRKR